MSLITKGPSIPARGFLLSLIVFALQVQSASPKKGKPRVLLPPGRV
jgi:hypothetical protein